MDVAKHRKILRGKQTGIYFQRTMTENTEKATQWPSQSSDHNSTSVEMTSSKTAPVTSGVTAILPRKKKKNV